MKKIQDKIYSVWKFLGGYRFLALLLVCLIASLAIKGTIGLYTDLENSRDNPFVAGLLDLNVGDTNSRFTPPRVACFPLIDLTF